MFLAPKARPKIAQGKRPQGASPWVRCPIPKEPCIIRRGFEHRRCGLRKPRAQRPQGALPWVEGPTRKEPCKGDLKKHRVARQGTGKGRRIVPLPLCPQSASPTGGKEAEEHEHSRGCTQGVAPPSASLALGWYASRFQRSNAAGTAALPGYLPPGRRRSQESNQSPISPRRRESIPTVQFVPTVQSMGSCLMSP